MKSKHPSKAIAPASIPILTIRDQKVVLDSDLAAIYGVATGRFNEAVKRNATCFPKDFSFVLTSAEYTALRSQFAILKRGRGNIENIFRAFSPNMAPSWPPAF